MIQSVNSNTSLTLDKPFAETTATNSNYRILLNTAAHFPSDTAAKVERALEQLSDINEAAINNDRTVTAATYINGKGLTNTTGDLNVYPASVNTNQGGAVKFHYNQSSSATSAVYEDQSGRVRINGNFYISGDVQSRIDLDNDNYLPLRIRRSSLVKGTAPSEITYTVIPFYGNVMNENSNSRVAMIQHSVDTNNVSSITLAAYGCNSTTDTTTSSIRCYVDGNGNAYTSAPTPASNDNSTKIATTAYTRAYTSATYLPLSCSSPITGTIMRDNSMARGGTTVYAATDTVPLVVRDANGKNWFRLITSQKYTSSSDFYSSVGFYVYHPTNASQYSNVANIAVGYNQNGPYTAAPTPPVDSNDTNIATTAWVNNFITRAWTVLNGSAVDIPTSTRTNALSVTFPKAGLYLVQYELSFSSNAEGYRYLTVGTSATGSSSDRFGAVLVPAAPGAQTILQLTRMERIYNSTTTYYLNGYQNSGSTLSVGNGIRYARIGEAD